MAVNRVSGSRSRGGVTIQLSLVGLVVFCVALVVAAGLLAYGFVRLSSRSNNERLGTPAGQTNVEATTDVPPAETPAWGDLLFRDIELEQPEEYIAFEMNTNHVPSWVFTGMAPDKVRDLMLSCGMTPDRVEHALAPQLASVTDGTTLVHPDDELVLSLSPGVRAKLYAELARDAANHYMRNPFCYPGHSFDNIFKNTRLNPATVDTVKKLLYPRGDAQCFSDYEFVLRQLPAEADRMELTKNLSRQSAVLARLRVGPNTDVDKVLGYWSRGIQVKDVRPLLESLARLPDGNSISILYLLPPFARQRLYTFPLPSRPGDPAMDCHWSTMNFFNETPDDRFADPNFTAPFIRTNYYQIAKPTLYGDLVFILDDHNQAIHSAVYLADDIVFTKNGNNFSQPWKLMRLRDLLAMYYTSGQPTRVSFYRNRSW